MVKAKESKTVLFFLPYAMTTWIVEKQPDFIRLMEALASPPAANKPGNRGEFTPHGV